MKQEQHRKLLSISSALDILASAGEHSEGIAFNMSQTCMILSDLLFSVLEDVEIEE